MVWCCSRRSVDLVVLLFLDGSWFFGYLSFCSTGRKDTKPQHHPLYQRRQESNLVWSSTYGKHRRFGFPPPFGWFSQECLYLQSFRPVVHTLYSLVRSCPEWKLLQGFLRRAVGIDWMPDAYWGTMILISRSHGHTFEWPQAGELMAYLLKESVVEIGLALKTQRWRRGLLIYFVGTTAPSGRRWNSLVAHKK